ncbi:MAG TPA: DinB family protein, partial [Ktedonobacterales bacterium]
MRTVRELYAYNTWANAQVFAICRDVEQARLDEQAPGTYGTLAETLRHLVGVEVVYTHMLRDEAPDDGGSRKEFFAHDLAWFAQRAAQAGQEYTTLLASANEAFYEAPLHV